MSTNVAQTSKDRFTKAIGKLASARPARAAGHVALQGSLAATIQESQREGTQTIAAAIGKLSSSMATAGKQQPSATTTATVDPNIAAMFAAGLDASGKFNPNNDFGNWFVVNNYTTIHDVCRARRRDFAPKMDRNRVGQGNPVIDAISVEHLKTVHDVCCVVEKHFP